MSVSAETAVFFSLIAASVLSLLGSLLLLKWGKAPVVRLARSTMLILGIVLTQLATAAERASEPRDLFQIGFTGFLLFALSAGAFIEARRSRAAGANT